LILSLCTFLERNQDVVTKFQTEPGEYRFRLKSQGKVCLFEVFEFDNNFCKDELEKGQCVISTQIETDKLINKFYRQILNLKEIGTDEFKKRWGYDFPKDAFMRLTQARKAKKASKNI
jgi:hypothetical protein